MKNIRNQFLRAVEAEWARLFPFLKPVELEERPKRGKLCNYIYQNQSKANFIYFISFQFSEIRIGEFTIDVSISHSNEVSVLDRRTKDDLQSLKYGSYRIGTFMGTKDYWWALVDVDSQNQELWRSVGERHPVLTQVSDQSRWRPSSFDLPPGGIISEALLDVNVKLQRFVFPRLDIK